MSSDGFTFEITEDHADCIVPGLDWLREQPGDVYIEHRVALDPWLPGQFGTLDVGIISPDGLCTIFDWKFGVGVPVAAEGNEQLRIYALGFWQTVLAPREIDPERFRIVIEQPRCPGGGGSWDVDRLDLLRFGDEIEAAGKRALTPGAPRVAGEKQCFWCDAKPNCTVYDKFVLDLASLAFDDLDSDDEPALPEALTPERRSYVVRHAKMLEDWISRQHAATLADALAGLPTPGLKVVKGRAGHRRWTDEDGALSLLKPVLGDQSVNMKVISPADAEKALKPKKTAPGHPEAWDAAQALITQSDPKPALVPEDDARPALRPAVASFEDLEASSPETP